MFDQFVNYLKYSGATVTFTLNPYHWRLIPKFQHDEEWEMETNTITFLFLSIRFWLDDGSW